MNVTKESADQYKIELSLKEIVYLHSVLLRYFAAGNDPFDNIIECASLLSDQIKEVLR